jgi:hypothetical protein
MSMGMGGWLMADGTAAVLMYPDCSSSMSLSFCTVHCAVHLYSSDREGCIRVVRFIA